MGRSLTLPGSSTRAGSVAPRVTVVTPTYNRAELIEETIASVLDQSFADFEYLIIDDGSRDSTEDVVRSFGDPRLSYHWHSNRGEAASTNRGWELARGEYFAFLSSDDPVLRHWLAETVRFMDEKPARPCRLPASAACSVHSSSPRRTR